MLSIKQTTRLRIKMEDLESLASELEVTVDYLIEEFLLEEVNETPE